MGIEVRVLSSNEGTVLRSVAPDVFDEPVDADLVREFLSDPRHHLAVAIDGDEVVGMASAVTYVHPDKPLEMWVNEVGVASAYHRLGIGRRLLDALFELGSRHGCRTAWVGTEPDNVAANGLYTAQGGTREEVVVYSFDLAPRE